MKKRETSYLPERAAEEIKPIEDVMADTIKDLKEEVFNQKVLIEKLTAENNALKKKNEKILKAFRDTLSRFDS